MDKEKVYTLKSAQSELKKLQAAREKKRTTIKKLSDGLKEDAKRIKELEKICDRLTKESLQEQIAIKWFKERSMTGDEVSQFLELGVQLHDKLPVLDVAAIVQAVTQFYDKKALEQNAIQLNTVTNASDNPAERATYSTSGEQSTDPKPNNS